jgi:hypothetical protein
VTGDIVVKVTWRPLVAGCSFACCMFAVIHWGEPVGTLGALVALLALDLQFSMGGN